jgi:hypothetical protein
VTPPRAHHTTTAQTPFHTPSFLSSLFSFRFLCCPFPRLSIDAYQPYHLRRTRYLRDVCVSGLGRDGFRSK